MRFCYRNLNDCTEIWRYISNTGGKRQLIEKIEADPHLLTLNNGSETIESRGKSPRKFEVSSQKSKKEKGKKKKGK